MIRTSLYNISQSVEHGDIELVEKWRAEGGLLWLDIQSSLTPEIETLLESFDCHELAMSDVRRERHPPKVEEFDEHTFIVFRGVKKIDEYLYLTPLQISFFVGDNYLITIHPDVALSIEQHVKHFDRYNDLDSKSLASSIMHFSCGLYLESLLTFDNNLAELEDNMLNNGSDSLLKDLVRYRSQLRKMRRTFTYHDKLSQDLIDLWDKDQDQGEFSHHLRNLYDRCERLSSLGHQQYEICGDLVDGYFSLTSHQLNNTMRVLTVITAIFVPLSFLAGLYGMNFDYIPELKVEDGYFILLGVMATLAVSMVVVFKKMKWF